MSEAIKRLREKFAFGNKTSHLICFKCHELLKLKGIYIVAEDYYTVWDCDKCDSMIMVLEKED